MPYKKAIMSHLDGLDELAIKMGACNNIYIAQDGTLRGTNTDWLGVSGCLLDGITPKKNRPALVIGAGGASKAAIHALATILECKEVYIVNRDDREVLELAREVKAKYADLEILHVESPEQAKSLPSPYYIIGTIPDIEPISTKEIIVHQSLEAFLTQAASKGVLLDMCYKPRRTRMLKLAERFGWRTIEGISIIGHQLEEQYRLWCGEDAVRRLPIAEAWRVLYQAAEGSREINF
ncbi:uncharacterized protein Z518_05722 [Rhinocladiella mackenziei CBS 650.93]|uniref:Quinate/shikimate 5-dehydrogenase/glutamyl-tRNA reductase domain-containing protein n=1 Tax=Rhinocladiella mackenziei CBS 650.93 TaxID=1442369 RepID=A0A0D2INY4_9EURO|nr:uncharacterized protein Z518_05722 [Rhinocladiella mackenziei CBS 650.93]KIX04851.1 hypothetical protein Z518_05722 [Rhinocladiella mackenziei CBS 650.93]